MFYGCNTNTTIHIGNGVTLIPNFAFWGVVGSGTLIIPNSVTNIGNVAFAECSGFSELLIGESVVTIGGDAFSGCSGLTSVTIPNSVTSIGNSAFYGCNSLTAVNFNAYNCATMGNSSYPVFSNCNANAIINIGEGVTTIPDYAFKGLIGSGTLTIPNSVTSIGQYAFSGCNGLRTVNFNATNCTLGSSNGISGNANITTLNIGENVANIPNSAFQNCSGLTTVNFNATNCTSMGSSSYPVFNGCNANATINIGNGVTTIPDYAFKGLIGSGTLTIPNSVTSIGQYAFYGCNGLTGALTIPNTVTNISTYAFNNCSGLSALTIGSGVASIGSSAFAGCSALAAVYYAGNIGQWCGITFDDQPLDNAHNLYINNNLVTDLVIPENTTEIKKNAFSGATCLTSATIPNTVTSIGQKAFYGCSGLSGTLTIPNSVSSIGNQAFGNCSGLTAVNFNAANCSTMGNSSNPAFGGCTSLSTLSIGENVRSIPANAFYNCNSLRTINFNATNCTSFGSNNGISGNTNITALNIGENVTNIPSSAFNGCTNITGALAIPSAVTSIGGNAFYNCSRITSLSIPNSVTSIGNGAFFNCSGLASISVGSGNSTYDSRDNCNAIIRKSNNQLLLGCNNTVIPESVRSIGSSAFYNCSSLRRVNIPQQLTSLGNDAFAGCSAITEVVVNATSLNSNYTQSPFSAAQTSLKKISLGEGVTRLPNYMFAGCTALDTIIANPTVPPTIYSSTFDYNHVSSTRVIVPCRTADIYSDADFWYNFRRIKQNEPCPTIYTVTALSNNNLFGTVSGGGEYEENSIVTLSATPNYGYRFTAWNDGNEENPRTISVTNDVTYIATFVEIPPVATYTITALSSNPAVGVVTGGGTYYEGTEVTLTANPNEGYAFVSWNDGETLNPRQITVSGDAMYIASFIVASVVTNYEVSVASSNLAYGSVSGSGTYSLGNVVTISATAFDGYMFTSWNDGNTENPRDITVIGDAMYVANFAVIPPTPVYTLTVLSINNAYGSVSGGGEYEENAVATLTATPNDGYEFTSWSDGSTDNPHEVTVTRNAMYIAYFDEIPQTPTYNITVIASNPNHGSVTGGGVYEANAEVTLTAIANEGYRFDVWSDGSTDNPRSITVTSDAMYVANFVEIQPTPIYTLTVLSINNAYGSVSGGGEYEENSVATLRATPNDGYEFTSWSDGSTDNPHEVIVTRNAMYVAYFDEIPQTPTYNITVIASNPNHGSVTGGGVYEANAEVTLTAIANEGYRFDVWSDGSTDNPRNITVTSDAMYVANFVEIPETPVYTLTVLSINNAYGSVSGGGEYEENAVATLSATANEGYEFTSWSDGSTDNPHEVTVTRDAMYVAYFDEIPQTPTYNITVIASNPNHGSVTGGGVYEANAEVTLTATAFDGCRFDVWSDGSTDSIRTITVTSDAIYIANFVHVDDAQTIYVTVVDTACGSYTWNNVTYTESGTYYRTFTAANSADSIVALGLVILPLPEPVITVDGILDACNPETTSVTLSAGEYSTYIWSTNETSETIVVSTPGYYFVEVVDSFGCHGNSEEMIIGYSTILTDAPMVKNLGMNASGYISFSWTAPQTEGIAGYEIYREDNTMDVFRHISSVGRNRKSIIDTTANPSERAYRYMVCAVDECGGMSPMSVPHKSVHLTINQGIDNSWNLIWSHYEGFELSSYIIYRGRTTSDMVVIDTVPSNLNSYTDYSNPDNEGFFYKVRPEKNTRSRTNDEDEDDDEMLSSNIVDNGHIVMRTVMAVTSNPLSGTVSGSGVYADGTQIEIEAIANEGYEFAAWNDGSIANPRSVTITSDTLFIANFVEIPQMATYTITVYSSNQAYGTVTGGGTYPEGTDITLTAIANSGYEFVSWSDGNSDNPRTLIVTNDAMFIATFVEASSVASYTITVISSNPTNGSVTGGGTYLEGTVISIEAIANEGYEFISWNDNNIDNPREITVTGDAMYIASFVPATDIAESAVPEISVYPNPVEDILNITSSVDIAEIEIVNVIGQIVLRKDVNSGSTVCDVAGLPSGVYTVRIRMLGGLEASEGMTTQMKFVKE